MNIKIFLKISFLAILIFFSGCNEAITGTDNDLNKPKNFKFEINDLSRSSKALAVEPPETYLISFWQETANGWSFVKDNNDSANIEEPSNMELKDNKFVKEQVLTYGYKYKASVSAVGTDGTVLFSNPNFVFKAGSDSNYQIPLFRTNSYIFAVKILNFNPKISEDNTSFNLAPKLILPFSNIDDLSLSVNKIETSGLTEVFATPKLEESGFLSPYVYQFEINQNINISTNPQDNKFIFKMMSNYDDVSSYGKIFYVYPTTDENGTTTVELNVVDFVSDYEITQTSDSLTLTLELESFSGFVTTLNSYEENKVLEKDESVSNKITFKLDKSQNITEFNFVLRTDVFNDEVLTQYSINIPQVVISNSEYQEEGN
jgi:hypothetical protein